jgi:hypothetical protein
VNYRPLRLGTRRSPMAIAQSRQVAGMITTRTGMPVEIAGVTTLGDVSRSQLAQLGGAGVFLSALREALLAGEVDLAVHSAKDLPAGAAAGIGWPPCRPGMTPGTRWWRGKAPSSPTCRPGPGSAPAHRAGRAAAPPPRRPTLRPDPRQRRHRPGG